MVKKLLLSLRYFKDRLKCHTCGHNAINHSAFYPECGTISLIDTIGIGKQEIFYCHCDKTYDEVVNLAIK